jgi:DNA-binding transcriptional MerR regulator
MADEQSARKEGGKLLTLTEVSNRTGISMPTLQRYKKEFQDRIPTVGEGRTQRYPASSLPVFEQIKQENIKKRGRPRKSGSGAGKPKPQKPKTAAPAGSDLLTLTEVGKRTGISYPTLVRYVKLHGDQIPHEGKGRKRRYHPEAVEVFNRLRSESSRGPRRGRKPAAAKVTAAAPSSGRAAAAAAPSAADPGLGRRVAALEKVQERLEKLIRDLVTELKKPMTVTLRRGK